MKEKPILFSTEMVRAILAGNKTVTRRIIKPQPDPDGLIKLKGKNIYHDTSARVYKPYAEPGMVLWVRETWYKINGLKYIYRADSPPKNPRLAWKPSIFMPREACRIRLEVLDVRPERLQDITEDDILKEGISRSPLLDSEKRNERFKKNYGISTLQHKWIMLWDSINAARGYPWDDNPWIWRIEFKIKK